MPTVLNAKARNPRFVLSVNPQPAGRPLTAIPKSAELSQNYPNPFNPETVIRYGVPGDANVQLSVYDLLGQRVRILIDEPKTAGRYEVSFNGSRLASGLYFYKLKIGTEVLTKKMVLIK